MFGSGGSVLVQVPDGDDRCACALSERHERGKRSAHVVITVGVDGTTEERDQRVDDHERRLDALDRGLDDGESIGDRRQFLEAEAEDAVEVGSGCFEARADRVSKSILG